MPLLIALASPADHFQQWHVCQLCADVTGTAQQHWRHTTGARLTRRSCTVNWRMFSCRPLHYNSFWSWQSCHHRAQVSLCSTQICPSVWHRCCFLHQSQVLLVAVLLLRLSDQAPDSSLPGGTMPMILGVFCADWIGPLMARGCAASEVLHTLLPDDEVHPTASPCRNHPEHDFGVQPNGYWLRSVHAKAVSYDNVHHSL